MQDLFFLLRGMQDLSWKTDLLALLAGIPIHLPKELDQVTFQCLTSMNNNWMTEICGGDGVELSMHQHAEDMAGSSFMVDTLGNTSGKMLEGELCIKFQIQLS